MSATWHWFVIAGTFLSLAFFAWLLVKNRRTSGKETTGHEWDGIEELDNPLPMWWVWMFALSIIYAIGYLVIYPGLGTFTGAIGWSSASQHAEEVAVHDARFAPLYARLGALDADALMQDKTAMQVGRRLFINHCSTCHGVNGNGAFGFPNLQDEEWIWGSDLAAIKQTISQGRQAQMPPWGPALGEQGVQNVAHYVLQMAGRDHDKTRADAGAAQYTLFCVACHGPDGKGNALLGAPDLTNDIWLYGGSLEQLSFTLTYGRQGNMPAQRNLLGEDKINILAAYVQSLTR
jgi:cytochrome c oxidase cbb3-type subunit 3